MSASSDSDDEFFDVPDEYEPGQSEPLRPLTKDEQSQEQRRSKLHTNSVLLEGTQDKQALTHYVAAYSYGSTLQKDTSCTIDCSWTSADPSIFLIRGESYLRDSKKIMAERTLMELVGVDWIKSSNREDDLGGRLGGIVQKYAQQDPSKYFFVANFQMPGSTRYNLVCYYMMDSQLENVPLLKRFIKGDDAYRNSRFKLITYVSEGPWIVKRSLGPKPCLLGRLLKLRYFEGKNYFEVDVDVGSLPLARSICNLFISYMNSLVNKIAFLIQGNTQDELPEILVGTACLNRLITSKAVPVDSCHTQIGSK